MTTVALPSRTEGGSLCVRNLSKVFGEGWHRHVAVGDVSFDVGGGESLGIAGESGSGKTTIARCIAGLIEPSAGDITFDGVSIGRRSKRAWKQIRPRIQMVFQDPLGSLDPRWTALRTLEEPLRLNAAFPAEARGARVRELLQRVNLDESFLDRYPHQMSGGQQQRICIARALANNPDLLILDEPTSALDALSRGTVLRLLTRLRQSLGLTYLFISHDLDAVARVCDRIIVLYSGQVMEEGPTAKVLSQPTHPYTIALASAVLDPRPDDRTRRRERVMLVPEEPTTSPRLPGGCPLYTRCPIATPACATTPQTLIPVNTDHSVACMRVSDREGIDWPAQWNLVNSARSERAIGSDRAAPGRYRNGA